MTELIISFIINIILGKLLWGDEWWACILRSICLIFPLACIEDLISGILISIICCVIGSDIFVPTIREWIEDDNEHNSKNDSGPKGPAFQG